MMNIKLGNKRIIGHDQPVYIVAEIGINHNGDMDLAKKTILAAKEAGADAVKFQNYLTEDFVPTRTVTHEYVSQGNTVSEFQYDMFKRYEINATQIIELKDFSDKIGIDFHSTPTNFEGVDLLQRINVPVLKNGSDYLTNLELVQYMGKTGLPTVLSSGMATIAEIDEAVTAFRDSGNNNLILLHCTSCYPTPARDVNLRKIRTLSQTFATLSGFSDHSKGPWASIASVAFDSCWIEKHFTLDQNLPGPDHAFSSDPKEFSMLVEGLRFAEKSLGVAHLGPTITESFSRENYRLSCATNRLLHPGDILSDQDVIYLRPGMGIPPKSKSMIVGRRIERTVNAFQILSVEDFSP